MCAGEQWRLTRLVKGIERKAMTSTVGCCRQLECVRELLLPSPPKKEDEPTGEAEKEQGAKSATLAQGLASELKSLKDGASGSERPGPKESWIRLAKGLVYVSLEVEKRT